MERVLTLKANYLADEFGYDVTVILTEEKDKPFYYPLSPKVKTINFDLNFDRMYGLPLHRRLVYYRKRLRKFKKLLTSTLCELKPDITVSLLRRDINFLNTVPDGSVKIGEIHFNRSNYRDFNNRMLPVSFGMRSKILERAVDPGVEKIEKIRGVDPRRRGAVDGVG